MELHIDVLIKALKDNHCMFFIVERTKKHKVFKTVFYYLELPHKSPIIRDLSFDEHGCLSWIVDRNYHDTSKGLLSFLEIYFYYQHNLSFGKFNVTDVIFCDASKKDEASQEDLSNNFSESSSFSLDLEELFSDFVEV
jgi:hypothetical protein